MAFFFAKNLGESRSYYQFHIFKNWRRLVELDQQQG